MSERWTPLENTMPDNASTIYHNVVEPELTTDAFHASHASHELRLDALIVFSDKTDRILIEFIPKLLYCLTIIAIYIRIESRISLDLPDVQTN